MLNLILLSSLDRVFPQSCPEIPLTAISCFENEPLSFQAAFRLRRDPEGPRTLPVYARVESDLDISTYLVGYVPVLHTDVGMGGEPAPGLFGDMLLPKKTNPPIAEMGYPWKTLYFEQGEKITLNAANDSWQSLWFIVNEAQKNVKPGVYPIRVRFFSGNDGTEIASQELTLTILAAHLPKQTLKYTNWFHCDCLADYYQVDLFSDRFFEIMRDFVKKAVRNGMNMILTPTFTPPLDTPVNFERRTAQLVKISVDHGKYSFDFSLLKKFMDICRKEGIEYFEHAHLFSQWGATSAPKILATVNGQEKQIFGWDTDAGGKKYSAFLHAYLPALMDFLRQEKLEKKMLFHISDEPSEANAESYRRALNAVGNLLDGYMTGDALSHYLFYEQGLVKTPIVSTRTVDEFVGKCEHLWAYYTGGQIRNGQSNRILVATPERNRMIGVQMYVGRIEGFLHWGYNYYYDLLSQGIYDPKYNPCGYNNNPGTAYSVYPGRDGTAIQSVHQKNFFEGLLDMRALALMEKRCGRAACDALIEEHFGKVTFFTLPKCPQQLLRFRQAVNDAIAQTLE